MHTCIYIYIYPKYTRENACVYIIYTYVCKLLWAIWRVWKLQGAILQPSAAFRGPEDPINIRTLQYIVAHVFLVEARCPPFVWSYSMHDADCGSHKPNDPTDHASGISFVLDLTTRVQEPHASAVFYATSSGPWSGLSSESKP